MNTTHHQAIWNRITKAMWIAAWRDGYKVDLIDLGEHGTAETVGDFLDNLWHAGWATGPQNVHLPVPGEPFRGIWVARQGEDVRDLLGAALVSFEGRADRSAQ